MSACSIFFQSFNVISFFEGFIFFVLMYSIIKNIKIICENFLQILLIVFFLGLGLLLNKNTVALTIYSTFSMFFILFFYGSKFNIIKILGIELECAKLENTAKEIKIIAKSIIEIKLFECYKSLDSLLNGIINDNNSIQHARNPENRIKNIFENVLSLLTKLENTVFEKEDILELRKQNFDIKLLVSLINKFKVKILNNIPAEKREELSYKKIEAWCCSSKEDEYNFEQLKNYLQDYKEDLPVSFKTKFEEYYKEYSIEKLKELALYIYTYTK